MYSSACPPSSGRNLKACAGTRRERERANAARKIGKTVYTFRYNESLHTIAWGKQHQSCGGTSSTSEQTEALRDEEQNTHARTHAHTQRGRSKSDREKGTEKKKNSPVRRFCAKDSHTTSSMFPSSGGMVPVTRNVLHGGARAVVGAHHIT